MADSWRSLFDIPADVSYLNTAYMSPLPRASLHAGIVGLGHKLRPWNLQVDDFFAPVERVRHKFAAVVGGDANGVAMVPSVSYGISLAAKNLPCAAGQEIVVLDAQFPSNIYPWRVLADRQRGRIVTVARSAAGWTQGVLDAISERTAVVAVPHCHWTDGTIVDVAEIGAAARRVGAALVIDGCQSVGALPIDVAQVGPDVIVSAAYKWLLGPYSLGCMWVAPERRSMMPLEHNWMQRAGAENFAGLVDYTDGYRPGARRYDVGEASNFALLPVFESSLDLILSIGVEGIAAHSRRLTDRLANEAEVLGLSAPPANERSPHLIGISIGELDPQRVKSVLADMGVFVSVRGRSVRVSAHLYNTDEDVERFARALRSVSGRD